MHRVVAQLRRRLATQGMQARGHRRHAHVDVRRTMRASLQTGGVPVELKFRPRRPRRPEIYVLCDVSTSVTSASVFFLSVLHALHDTFRKMRSFVFIERISEVTDIFEHERNFKAVSERIASDAGVADISGYTDYGRVWSEFLEQVEDDLHPRATVIVLGDARTNGRDPRADIFAQIAARAGRTFWLNPEPRLYWNYGDSVIAAYEQYCTAFECWTTAQLEDFVRALTRPVDRAPRASISATASRHQGGWREGRLRWRTGSDSPGADPSNLWGNAREGSEVPTELQAPRSSPPARGAGRRRRRSRLEDVSRSLPRPRAARRCRRSPACRCARAARRAARRGRPERLRQDARCSS